MYFEPVKEMLSEKETKKPMGLYWGNLDWKTWSPTVLPKRVAILSNLSNTGRDLKMILGPI